MTRRVYQKDTIPEHLQQFFAPAELGLEPSPVEYVEAIRATFAEARRVLADDGVLWLNLGDSYVGSANSGGRSTTHRGGNNPTGTAGEAVRISGLPTKGGMPPKNMLGIPWRVAFALQDDGWILRNAVIWNKPNAMPESVTDRLSTRYEHLFLFSKSRRYWFDLDPIREPIASTREAALTWDRPLAKERDLRSARVQKRPGRAWDQDEDERGRNPGDVWTIPTSPFPGAHFATMPPELARRCILSGCKPGGTVLDPFSGSGTTGAAATTLGRRYVGIDLNAEYLDLSLRTRLAQTALIDGEASA